MGRDDHNRKMHDGNNAQLPMTSANDVSHGKQDAELADEVDSMYSFERTPGLGVTGVEKKVDRKS